MSLHAAVDVSLGDLRLAVDLDAPAGVVTALLGPNGAGKTTLLRCVAGAVAIDAGTITLGGTVLDDAGPTFVVPERRQLGIVHQDYVLFPHLSALDNVAFGLRARRRSANDARAIARCWLERAGVGAQADLKPEALSGGQAQRVALARALATDPAALLLDEPLAALDADTRTTVRRDLHRFLADYQGVTILVTHDPIDALALADHVAILERGSLTQAGTLAEVTTRPRSRYVAGLLGTNLLHGAAKQTTITTVDGTRFTTAEAHHGTVFATIAPSAVALHRREPEGSPRNRWSTSVSHLDRLGDRVRVHLSPPLNLVAEVTPAAVDELDLHEGAPIWASVKATEIAAYGQ